MWNCGGPSSGNKIGIKESMMRANTKVELLAKKLGYRFSQNGFGFRVKGEGLIGPAERDSALTMLLDYLGLRIKNENSYEYVSEIRKKRCVHNDLVPGLMNDFNLLSQRVEKLESQLKKRRIKL